MKSSSKSVLICLLCVSFQMPTAVAESDTAKPPLALGGDLEARVNDLLKKTKSALRLIKGGTFEMGDWGTDSGIPYDGDRDSKPLHKVTLDTFSMMAYKVTYEEFDIFTDSTGEPLSLFLATLVIRTQIFAAWLTPHMSAKGVLD